MRFALRMSLVPEAGLEPARVYTRGILSPLCLPFHHPGGQSRSIPTGGEMDKADMGRKQA